MTDGAAAAGAGGRRQAPARCASDPAWITGLSTYVDPISMGTRDLTRSPSTAERRREVRPRRGRGGRAARAVQPPGADPARASSASADDVAINPSGGALAGNPMFTAGLNRIGEAAERIWSGEHAKVLGHATSGPALQQNLVCTMASPKEAADGQAAGRRRRDRPDPPPRQARGRLDGRPVPRGDRPRPRGRRTCPSTTSTRSWSARRRTCSRA